MFSSGFLTPNLLGIFLSPLTFFFFPSQSFTSFGIGLSPYPESGTAFLLLSVRSKVTIET